MLWRQFLILSAAASQAAVLPPAIMDYTRLAEPAVWQFEFGEPVWKEYGLQEAETAEYKASSGRPFAITAWRMADATGAMAAFQWLRPVDSTPIPTLRYGVRWNRGILAAQGNYLLRIEGYRPSPSELVVLFQDLEGYRNGPLPLLPTYLPEKRNAAADRYIVGPQSLREFLPDWSVRQAAFDLGAEVQLSEVPGARLIIARYPTQHIARAKLKELSQLPGALVHRSGPLLALLLPLDGSPQALGNPEAIFAQIEFRGGVIANEANPLKFPKQAADMVLSIFALAGILLLICLGAGLVVGGIRILRARNSPSGEPFQTLNLSGR
jgi:hypothetical protein